MDPILGRARGWALALGLAAQGLAGCGPSGVVAPPPEQPRALAGGGANYRIDPAASEIHVLVYRAGPLARLGHNHVVAVTDPEGSVLLRPEGRGSRFELLIDADDLEVDSAPLRARYGEAFASTPGDEDIAATRANMLGADVLDAQAYPTIRVAGTLRSAGDDAAVDLRIALKRTVLEREVPITLEIGGEKITARGTLELDHADLGLTPFSVMLGALRVAETLEIRFDLTARPTAGD